MHAGWLWSFQFHIINSERSFASSYSMNHQSAIGVALFFFKLWILPTYAKRGADYPISCLDSSKSNFGRWVSIGKCNFFTTVHNVYSINSEILWECCARRCSRKINQMKLGNCVTYTKDISQCPLISCPQHTQFFSCIFLGVIQSEVWNGFKIPIFFRPCKKTSSHIILTPYWPKLHFRVWW